MLPLCYTEFVMERLQKKDAAAADFLDIFNHLILSLFTRPGRSTTSQSGTNAGRRISLSQHLGDFDRELEPGGSSSDWLGA